MHFGFRVFHHRVWELELCNRYGLGIEYRIDNDSEFEEGGKNAKLLERILLPVFFHYPSKGNYIWLSHSDEEARKKAIEKFKKYLDLSKRIKACLLVIHDETPFGGLEPYLKSLEEVSKLSKRKRIKVCLENTHLSPFQVCELIDDIPNLYIALDLGHANIQIGSNGILAFLDKFWYKVEHLHLHDNYGVHDQHLIPGDGNLDYEKILKKLNDINFDGFGILELNWDIPPEEGIKRSLAFLKRYLK
ncbi:MAG: hypothetical protein DRO65_00745 [Candidatus Altiarchaeales archaeon]|nr:MAG: hypothetical protein DRO65_00745 [Candidatus Altiarchaeales archaeon]